MFAGCRENKAKLDRDPASKMHRLAGERLVGFYQADKEDKDNWADETILQWQGGRVRCGV